MMVFLFGGVFTARNKNLGGEIVTAVVTIKKYNWLPITRTLKGQSKTARVIGSSKKVAGSKEKKQFLLHSEHFNHI